MFFPFDDDGKRLTPQKHQNSPIFLPRRVANGKLGPTETDPPKIETGTQGLRLPIQTQSVTLGISQGDVCSGKQMATAAGRQNEGESTLGLKFSGAKRVKKRSMASFT